MTKRNLSLTPRLEDIRLTRNIEKTIEFDLQDIESHFNGSISLIKNNFEITENLMKQKQAEKAKDVYRSQVVFVVSALDYFLHEITKYGLYKIFKGDWEKNEKYKKFKVTMNEVENVINVPDSKLWFYEYVNNFFSTVVMISPESIKEQLNLTGIGYENVCKKMYLTKNCCDDFKNEFQTIYDRRNKIAHQNDYSHKSYQRNDIDKAYVLNVINTIEKFSNVVIEISKGK